MDVHSVIKELEARKEFTEWKEKHPDEFLAHAFVMMDEPNKGIWQIGYYDKSSNKMSTFVVNGKQIEIILDQDVLKSDAELKPLQLDEVKLSIEEALEIAQKTRVEQYAHELPAKLFFIIQHSDGASVFNITFFTSSFKTINVKVSTIDGKVLSHSLQSLVSP